VDPVPDPLPLRKSGSAGNRTRDLWILFRNLILETFTSLHFIVLILSTLNEHQRKPLEFLCTKLGSMPFPNVFNVTVIVTIVL
jgi:hypothetical protein